MLIQGPYLASQASVQHLRSPARQALHEKAETESHDPKLQIRPVDRKTY